MAVIEDITSQIKTAVYGKDVRSNIADGLTFINDTQNDLLNKFAKLIINDGDDNSEIVIARGEFDTLGDALTDHKINIINNYNNIQSLKYQINGAINGSPLLATLASQMTDITRNYNYLGTESGYTHGNVYCWDTVLNKFVDSGTQYQTTGIAPEGILHSNYKKKSISGDNLGIISTLRDILDYTPHTSTWQSGYIIAPNIVLSAGEIQVETKIGTASSGYIYLLEKHIDNTVTVKASMPYNFVVGINTINTGFIAEGNGLEYVGIYGLVSYNATGATTGFYWTINTTTPTNTTFTANAVSTIHYDPAIKIKTLGSINTNHINEKQIVLSKLGDDVINRFGGIDQELIHNSSVIKSVDLNTKTTHTLATTGSHPTTNGRLWISNSSIINIIGKINIRVKAVKTVSEYVVLLKKVSSTAYTIVDKQLVSLVMGINVIATGLQISDPGEYYIGITDRIVSSTNGTSGNFYYDGGSTGNYIMETFDFDPATRTSIAVDGTDGMVLSNYMFALEVTVNTMIKQSIGTLESSLNVLSESVNNTTASTIVYDSVIPKSIDFNVITTQTIITNDTNPATIGRLWGCLNIPLTNMGFISVKIKAIKTVSEYIVLLKKVSGSTYTVINKQLISIPIGTNTISTILEITEDGEYYIGITDRIVNSSNGTSGSFYFSNSSTGNYVLDIFDFDPSTRTSVTATGSEGVVLTNFIMAIEVTVNTSIKQAILDVKGSSINNTDIPKDVIYTEKFQTIPEPPYGSWVESGTTGVFNNGYTPVAASDFSNYLYLNQYTNFDTDTIKFQIQLNDITSKFRIARIARPISVKTTTVEYDNGVIKLYGVSKEFGFLTVSSVLISKTLTMSLVNGRTYTFTLENFGFVIRFKIADDISGEVEQIEWDCTNQASAGLCMDYPLISLANGNITVKQFDYLSRYSRSPKVIIIGDSVVEGITIKDDGGWRVRWAQKVYDALNGDCAILAVGGESTETFISKLPILKRKFYRPSYVFLELMSNDTDFNAWKTNTEILIDWAESIGATPVLCMMQKTKMALDFYNSVLNYVINTKYIVINFYKGMTKNGDGVTNIDSLFLSDHIHPNQSGHARMFKQVQTDIPEIFPLDYV